MKELLELIETCCEATCPVCGSDMDMVRPGKWQCQKCELDGMLSEAHKKGWEQAKAELAERDEQLLQMQNAAIDLTKQLADSQQECDRLKEELEASDWVGEQACKAIESAIKRTARECIEAIEKQHGGLGLAFTLRQRYGLEG